LFDWKRTPVAMVWAATPVAAVRKDIALDRMVAVDDVS
jgi:hypothetical protein